MPDLMTLIEQYTSLKQITRTHGGGEFAGSCPFCGGQDRFRVWPAPDEGEPHYWCRGCNQGGGLVAFLHEKEGLSWAEAYEVAEKGSEVAEVREGRERKPGQVKSTPTVEGAPCMEWQISARVLCKQAMALLWSEAGAKALGYLRNKRGLSDETIRRASLGFLPRDLYESYGDWGLPTPRGRKKMFIAGGITIPYLWGEQLWKVQVRRPFEEKDRRYLMIEGSANALYLTGEPRPGQPMPLVEGEFDALVLAQEATRGAWLDLAVAATGGTDGGRNSRSMLWLSLSEVVPVCFDPDEGGNARAQWWLERLEQAARWSPGYGDVSDIHRQGYDVAEWIARGIEHAREALASRSATRPPEFQGEAEPARRPARRAIEGACDFCTRPARYRDLHDRLWCAQDAPNGATDSDGYTKPDAGPGSHDPSAAAGVCWLCGEEMVHIDLHERAWCNEHAPQELRLSDEQLAAWLAPDGGADAPQAEPAPLPGEEQCMATYCHRRASRYDGLGNQWCEACEARQNLMNFGLDYGFPAWQDPRGGTSLEGAEAAYLEAATRWSVETIADVLLLLATALAFQHLQQDGTADPDVQPETFAHEVYDDVKRDIAALIEPPAPQPRRSPVQAERYPVCACGACEWCQVRSELRALGAAHGWPRVQLTPWSAMLPGEAGWEIFLARHNLATLRQLAAKIKGPGA